jgi:lysophospholipase L1-like esterase
LGDSITDGRGSTTNMNNRWPDALARRLRTNAATPLVSVVNVGIGGNTVLSGGLGPTARQRFDRDVLGTANVRWVLVMEGVNDIGGGGGNSSAMTDAYQEFIDKAHAAGVLAYGIPILPVKGGSYEPGEATRVQINDWIRSSGAFDAVLPLDEAVADANDPNRLAAGLHDGDWLHLNPQGYQAVADAIDLSLFVTE